MAQAAVSFVTDKLGDLVIQEVILLHGVLEQVERLQRELQRERCFLRDADSKRKTNERVKNWVREIRDIAHQAEDIVDSFMVAMHKHHRRTGVTGFIKRYTHIASNMIARHKTSMQITRIEAKIREVSESRITYGISNLDEIGTELARLPFRKPVLLPHVDDPEIVAFDNHKTKLVAQLLDPDKPKRCVISIVGIGGLGKTTLARKVYNSFEVKQEFDVRVWVTVSQDYNSVELLNKILHNIRGYKEELVEEEVIAKVYESLKETRYLIVMDDVWRRDAWEKMQEAFPDEKNASRVLITSRFWNVAKFADPTTQPYELQLLNAVESFELLLQKALPNQDVMSCPEELQKLGRKIAKKCYGLPLALVVVGGLLSTKDGDYSAWLRVQETMSWQFEGKECMDILALSYEDLPHYLKSCFLYFAAFPEDTEILAGSLIKLWIAEGFIPEQGRGTKEEVAENCLEELIQRCMVQVASRKSNGRSVKSCRVHDLLRDLAISEAKEDSFLVVYNNLNQDSASAPGRRAAFHNLEDIEGFVIPNLRTLLGFNLQKPNFRAFEARLKLLRVIDLKGALGIFFVPEEIKEMFFLRYLGLSSSRITSLPSSIGHLQNLETLDVTNTNINSLPCKLWEIRKLRHVLISKRTRVEGPPPSANLVNLQTLGMVGIPASWETSIPFLNNLRRLGLHFGTGAYGKMLSVLLAKLDHLVSLTAVVHVTPPPPKNPSFFEALPEPDLQPEPTIPLEIDTRKFPCHYHIQSMWLHGLWYAPSLATHEFPPYIIKLTLYDSKLKHDPMPILEKLQNLKILRLMKNSYMGKKMVCSAGGFPQLQRLQLCHLKDLEEWVVEAAAMPKLRHLHIQCSKLQMLPELQCVTSLQELELEDLPQVFLDRIARGTGEDWYKIEHVQFVSAY